MKKKLTLLLTFLLVAVLALTLVACGDNNEPGTLNGGGNNTQNKLESNDVVAEGTFDEGVTLSVSKIDSTDQNYTSALQVVEDKQYDKEKVAVYDVSLVKDSAKVQPDGKVKITMPAPFESEHGYVTYHLKGETVEELKTILADGKISFETSSFSYFVVTAKSSEVDPQKVTALVLDAHDAGFTYDGDVLADKTVVGIGAEYKPNAEDVLVSGVTEEGNKSLTKDDDYTIDLGGLDFNVPGVYTITYTYKKDTSIKATLTVEVVEAEELAFVFSYSQTAADSREREYNGAAVFVSKKDIIIGGTPLSEITDEELLSKISFGWRDKNTKQPVASGSDITIDGTTYTFGSDSRLVGDEIAGPCVVGEYEFVLSYEENNEKVEKLVIPATITERRFKKITTLDEFNTCEGAGLFQTLNYYTIVGIVDGKLYVMQMPADGSTVSDQTNVEAEARLVTALDDDGISLGGQFDFVFTDFRYYLNEWVYYPDSAEHTRENLLTDFGTGYYGSRLESGGPAGTFTYTLYRKGWTSLSGDKIVRNKEDVSAGTYGNLTKFLADGSVKIYAPRKGESENNALRLVKDGEKFVFTGKDVTSDTRPSYPVYIYKYYVPAGEQTGTYEFYNKLSKTYDGDAVQFNAYKDVYIQTEDGDDVGSLLKMGTCRFVFTDLKGNEILVGSVQDDGTVTGPSAVGQYQLVFQIQEKGEDGPIWVDKAVLHEFAITAAT